MLRVIFTPDIFSLQRVGGISRYYVELARRIPGHSCLKDIVAGAHLNQYLRNLSGIRGIYLPKLGPLGRYRLQANHALCRQVARRHPSAVIHLTYYSEVEYPRSHPLVITVPDMIDELFPHRPTSIPPGLKRSNCERADRIIAISDVTKMDIVNILGIPPRKITVVHLADSPPTSRGDGPESSSRKYLLYVGIRDDYKNFLLLVESFAASPFLREYFDLLAVGGGDFKDAETATITRLGLADRIHYVQAGDDRALARFYRNATALIYPSLYEGFGLPILEAMGQGCPVICADPAGSMKEIAGDAAAYFDPRDPESMRTVIESTLKDSAKLAALRGLGLARHKLYSWEKCVAETLNVYHAVANRSESS